MFTRSLALTVCTLLAMTSPVLAGPAFEDVPAGHWAYQAVEAVAIRRGFIKAYPDGRFHGNEPFTRLQLSVAVAELITQLEKQTQVSWASPGLGGYEFLDLPVSDPLRPTVLRLANQYRLFEGVPGVTSKTFEGGKQVTRYEMARVVERLMRLGEDQGVVNPGTLTPRTYVFTDVPESAWALMAVKNVAERYQVMVGFPDGSFRGAEKLTRFEFAASASQTFPLVQELVRRTQAANHPETTATAAWRYGEEKPLFIEVATQASLNRAPYGNLRGVAYRQDLFVMAEGNVNLPAGDRALHGAGLDVGYAWPVGSHGHLQPFLGARGLYDGAQAVGGLSYGLLWYHRPVTQWAAYGQLKGTTVWPTGVSGATLQLAQLGGGLEWHVGSGVGLSLEGGIRSLPQNLNTNAAILPFPYLGVGVQFKAW